MKIICTLQMLEICVEHSLMPLIQIDEIDEIIVIRNSQGPQLPKVQYYCPTGFLRKNFILRIIAKYFILIYLIIKKKPNFIISYYLKAHGLIALFAGKIFRLPVNLNVMSGPQEFQLLRIGKKDFRLKSLERLFLFLTNYFNSVTTTGNKTKEYLIENGVKKEIIDVLPDAVDLENFCPVPMKKEYDIITVARFDPAKRLEIFLQVIAKVKEKKPDIKVALIGDGILKKELVELSQELDIEKNVHFLGYKNNVENYYNASKIFILTSEREGFPMVVLEAMGCGLACVVSNVGNILDLADDGYNSIVVQDWADVESYTLGVLKLLNEPSCYNSISYNAIKSVRENYSYENAREVWIKILSKN